MLTESPFDAWTHGKMIDVPLLIGLYFLLLAAPVAEWLRTLIFRPLIACHLTAVGSSLARVTCETSQVLLAGGQVFFLGDLPLSPHLAINSAQNE